MRGLYEVIPSPIRPAKAYLYFYEQAGRKSMHPVQKTADLAINPAFERLPAVIQTAYLTESTRFRPGELLASHRGSVGGGLRQRCLLKERL